MSQIDCRLYEEVCAFLFDEWDPIGVKVLGFPRDEYDSYAAGLIRLVLAGADEGQVAARLAELARDQMGLAHVENERDKDIARRLIALVRLPRTS
jgi:hypothetical protein